MAGFSSEQLKVARELFSAPQARTASPKVKLALAETPIVESSLSRDPQENSEGSAGPLQQTPKDGWGTLQQVDNPRYAAEQFLKRAIPLQGKYGTAGELAQAVQRSAYPKRYGEHASEASDLLKLIGGGSGSAGEGSALQGALGGSKTTISGGNTPAQGEDLAALLSQLSSKSSAPSVAGVSLPSPTAEPSTGIKLPRELPTSETKTPAALLSLIAKIGEDGGNAGVKQEATAAPVTHTDITANAKGAAGFTPQPGKDYSYGMEPVISQRLNTLGKTLGIKLTGISGYRTPQHSVAVGGFADDPHTKGLASDTEGAQSIPKAVLNKYGLERPFPGAKEANHIQLLHAVNKNGGY